MPGGSDKIRGMRLRRVAGAGWVRACVCRVVHACNTRRVRAEKAQETQSDIHMQVVHDACEDDVKYEASRLSPHNRGSGSDYTFASNSLHSYRTVPRVGVRVISLWKFAPHTVNYGCMMFV